MKTIGTALTALFLIALAGNIYAAPKSELWPRWQVHDQQSQTIIDHSAWGDFLQRYLVPGENGAASLIRYAAVTEEDHTKLSGYLDQLAQTEVSTLNREEQKAYWINLYNALTVDTILNNYPVESIREIKSGWFSGGPWDLTLITVEGVELTLNDIEHRILRPIWRDARIHYAVNCASIGCPNLQQQPFTAANSEGLLNQAAQAYINSPRGAELRSGKLYLSSIYDWFSQDFGISKQELLQHIASFAKPELAEQLKSYNGGIAYHYSWDLNILP